MSSGQVSEPTPNVTGEGKGVKRAPEEQQQEEEEQEKGVGGDSPPTKTTKLTPPTGDNTSIDVPADEQEKERGGVAVAAVARPTDSERVEAETLRSLGLAVGTRLEVMWLLEEDDKSVEKVRGSFAPLDSYTSTAVFIV